MAFEEVSERIETIPVLNDGIRLVHWAEGGEETDATERGVSITARGDDTLLTGLEKLGNVILVLLEEGTVISGSVLDMVWVVSKVKDCDKIDLILDDGEKLLDCLWLVKDVELSALTEVILTSSDDTRADLVWINEGMEIIALDIETPVLEGTLALMYWLVFCNVKEAVETTSLLNGEGAVDERSPLTEVFDVKELNDSSILVVVLGLGVMGWDTKLGVAFTVVIVGRTLVDDLGIFAVWSMVKF